MDTPHLGLSTSTTCPTATVDPREPLCLSSLQTHCTLWLPQHPGAKPCSGDGRVGRLQPHLVPECHQGQNCDQFLSAPCPALGTKRCKTSLWVCAHPSPLITLAALLSSFSFTPASFLRQDNEKSMDYSNHGHSRRLIISILKTLLS